MACWSAVFGPALRADKLPLPGAGAPGGRTSVRCLALRVDVKEGLAGLHDLVLDTPSLLLLGEGALQLRDERLALRLVPTLPAGGPPTPAVRIGGVFTRTTIYPEQNVPALAARRRMCRHRDVCADAQAIARAAMPKPRSP